MKSQFGNNGSLLWSLTCVWLISDYRPIVLLLSFPVESTFTSSPSLYNRLYRSPCLRLFWRVCLFGRIFTVITNLSYCQASSTEWKDSLLLDNNVEQVTSWKTKIPLWKICVRHVSLICTVCVCVSVECHLVTTTTNSKHLIYPVESQNKDFLSEVGSKPTDIIYFC